MSSFKKIILTTDLSANAEIAFPYAIDLAKRYDGVVYIVNVFEDRVYYDSTIEPSWFDNAQRERERIVSDRVGQMADAGVTAVPVVLEGSAAQEIVRFAKSEKADIIVIGTHGRTGFSHFFFGSVAERVMRLSPCPVLTVRTEEVKRTDDHHHAHESH